MMSTSTADRFLRLLQDDRPTRLGLLACSAALQLDDETACEAVKLVSQTKGSSCAVVRDVKELGCVWKEWNGYWHVSEDVRCDLSDWLYKELPENTIVELHKLLANAAEHRAGQIKSDDQVSAHEKMLARFEAAYHRLLTGDPTKKGATELVELWRQLPAEDGDTLALSVDYIADELAQRLGRLPDEIVFLRGIAARERGDNDAQERYFTEVWNKGRDGSHAGIHASAAHFLGQLIQRRDRQTAETALRDSLEWTETRSERGRVLYSIGLFLAEDPNRRAEAEQSYDKALELLDAPEDREQVAAARAALDPYIQIPATWTDNATVEIEELRSSIRDQTYDFVRGYYRRRRAGGARRRSGLIDDVYAKFFEPHPMAWRSQAEFYTYIARSIRRILIRSAGFQYSTKFYSGSYGPDSEEFELQRVLNLLTQEKALALLREYDPNQARIVDLRFYAGLSLEKIADVMQLEFATVESEWRTWEAFLRRNLTRETRRKISPEELISASLMTSTKSFLRSITPWPTPAMG